MNIDKIRKDFPFLRRKVNGKAIIYFDNASTTQKPRQVIDSVNNFYCNHCSNVHRGAHTLSQEASELYEQARIRVARHLNCDQSEIIFVRNSTEAINLVAMSLKDKGSVLTSLQEHHSNLLPWQRSRKVKLIDLNRDGSLRLESLRKNLNGSVALLALSHVSNVLGRINPLAEALSIAREKGVLSLIDASQSIPCMNIDVRKMDCDFLAFSGHKMLAPSGIGVLYVKHEVYDRLRPWLLGGGMVTEVGIKGIVFDTPPACFEAGTPNIEGAIGLSAAIDYLENIGMENVLKHEKKLLKLAVSKLKKIKNLELYGVDEDNCIGIIAFNAKNIGCHSIAKILNFRENIMIRAGYHCAQPLHQELSIGPSARASFYIYNTEEEVVKMAELLQKAIASV